MLAAAFPALGIGSVGVALAFGLTCVESPPFYLHARQPAYFDSCAATIEEKAWQIASFRATRRNNPIVKGRQ